MFLAISFLPATVFAVLGYIVLYCAIRSTGPMGVLGRILSAWVFVLAVSLVVAGGYMAWGGMSTAQFHQQMMAPAQ